MSKGSGLDLTAKSICVCMTDPSIQNLAPEGPEDKHAKFDYIGRTDRS